MLSLKLARHIRLCRQQTVRNLSRVWNRVIKCAWDCVNVLNDAPVGLHAGNGWIFSVNVMCNAGDFGLVNEQLDGWSPRAWCWGWCHTHYLTHRSPVGTKQTYITQKQKYLKPFSYFLSLLIWNLEKWIRIWLVCCSCLALRWFIWLSKLVFIWFPSWKVPKTLSEPSK